MSTEKEYPILKHAPGSTLFRGHYIMGYRDYTGVLPEYTLWMQFAFDGPEDWRLEVLSDLPPTGEDDDYCWVTDEAYGAGPEAILDLDSGSWGGVEIDGVTFRQSMVVAALELGLVPYQPFLVRVGIEWYKSSWEYNEYDCNKAWEILYITPRKPETVARLLEKWLRKHSAYQKQKVRAVRAHKESRFQTVECMFFQWDAGFTHYDEMSPPDIEILRLCSDYPGKKGLCNPHYVFYSTRCQEGSLSEKRAVCKDEMFAWIRENMPHVDPEVVPTRRRY